MSLLGDILAKLFPSLFAGDMDKPNVPSDKVTINMVMPKYSFTSKDKIFFPEALIPLELLQKLELDYGWSPNPDADKICETFQIALLKSVGKYHESMIMMYNNSPSKSKEELEKQISAHKESLKAKMKLISEFKL